MIKTALITGASNGIGYELAKIHAKKGDNLVLVARNKEKLDELKIELEKKFTISVLTIKKDLSVINSTKEIYDETKKKGIKIDYLINNAGIGDFGFHYETDWDKELQLINLNITALTHLTKLYLPDLINQKSGKIMNVASVAAFVPGPKMAVYFASKAYVLSYSEAVDHEVRKYGVTITVLCPGATQSGFFKAAEMIGSKLSKNKKLPTSKIVAKYGYNSMMSGKRVAIHKLSNYLLVYLNRFSPRNLTTIISGNMLKNN